MLPKDYKYTLSTGKVSELSLDDKKTGIPQWGLSPNLKKDKYLYSKNGKLCIYNVAVLVCRWTFYKLLV